MSGGQASYGLYIETEYKGQNIGHFLKMHSYFPPTFTRYGFMHGVQITKG